MSRRSRSPQRRFAAAAVLPIALEAGISVQTLYSTFGSKQGLLLALVDTVRAQIGGAEARGQIVRSGHPDELIEGGRKLARAQILEVCRDIIVTFREGSAGDPEVAAA